MKTAIAKLMDKNKQKEQFNVSYLNAIAAQAGFIHARTEVDDDSVDKPRGGAVKGQFGGSKQNEFVLIKQGGASE